MPGPPLPRVALGLVLLAGGAAALEAYQGMGSHRPARRVKPIETTLPPITVDFRDVAAEAGLAAPNVSGGGGAKKYILETTGSGVAVLDYDGDGLMDVFLANGTTLAGDGAGAKATSHLYRNLGRLKFQDVTEAAGVGRTGWGQGVCAADYDNDGDTDLFAAYFGQSVLYRNEGNGRFTDGTETAGLRAANARWDTGCSWFDYDLDGKLDLIVTSYLEFDRTKVPEPGAGGYCLWKGIPVMCGPRGLPFGKVTLYHNRGDDTFEDVSAKSGMRTVEGFYAFTAVAADYNGDGWIDVYIACDSTPSIFFRNNKDGTFSDIAAETGVAFNEHGFEQGGMGIAVGDFLNDGRLHILKTNFAGDYPNVYRNLGGGIFEDVVMKARLAVNPQYVGWGVGLVDLDNDGWKDVFQVNGHVYPELDTKNGPERYRNPRLVYRNLGAGVFEDVSAISGPGVQEKKSSRGAAFGDFDNDGAIDVLIMNMGEAPSLLRNHLTSENHWLKIELEGTKSNRSAIGAIVQVEAGKLKQTDVVLSQSSYISHNDSRLHFGLGAETAASSIRVQWPNGAAESFPGAPAGKCAKLVEGSGKTQIVPMPK